MQELLKGQQGTILKLGSRPNSKISMNQNSQILISKFI